MTLFIKFHYYFNTIDFPLFELLMKSFAMYPIDPIDPIQVQSVHLILSSPE